MKHENEMSWSEQWNSALSFIPNYFLWKCVKQGQT